MTIVLLFIIWCLCYAITLHRIKIYDGSLWNYILSFFLGPFLHIAVLVGFGVTGYMKHDWEDLL